MVYLGVSLAVFSGLFNGLFTAPMKMIPHWKWENIWLVFIVTACLIMPFGMVASMAPQFVQVFANSPAHALLAAVTFGFAWGFGAILFGQSVDKLGVSLANSLVIGLSSAMGSLVPLIMQGHFHWDLRLILLLLGITAFILGVVLCGKAGTTRQDITPSGGGSPSAPSTQLLAYCFCVGAGIMSAIFNIGYTLALPIADAGMKLGLSNFAATHCIWLLMLGAGSIPNIVFCFYLMNKNSTRSLILNPGQGGSRAWIFSIAMGLLWGGSIYLYGAATPLLGDIGPSIGWPLSLAVGLLVANLMGVLLGEWRKAGAQSIQWMRYGIVTILIAAVLCAAASKIGAAQ